MAEKKATFEDNLVELEKIVTELEQGDVPLEKALTQFQNGVKLSSKLQKTLENAEKTLTSVMNDSGEEIPFEQGSEND